MRALEDQKGVTLLELMIVLIILGILLGGMYNTFQAQERAYVAQDQLAEMNQTARVALEIMSRDMRNAASDPLGTSGATIQDATVSSILFSHDTLNAIDCQDLSFSADGLLNCPGEWLGYRFDADKNQIEKYSHNTQSCGDCWESFVENVKTLRFRYIYADGGNSDDDGGPDAYTDGDDTNDLDDICQVEIQIQARSGNPYATAFQRTLTSRVQMRNLVLQ